jgi:peptidoglycan/LPS O-acetylase OafA/YrhL
MTTTLTPVVKSMPRYPVLDGWRGISILCVLAAHMLPLGPKSWQLNELFAPLGMCLFFTLSGFLITNTLIYRSNVRDFLIRRFCRILPLAWAFMLVALPLAGAPPKCLCCTLPILRESAPILAYPPHRSPLESLR